MPKSANQKLKMFYTLKMLWEETDEEHTLTVNQIINRLAQIGIQAERKSVYDDMETMQEFGYDIICLRRRSNEYFLASRDFQLPELKLLVDAVVASKFITRNKSMELIRKLERCTNRYYGKELQRQVLVSNRIKNMNETIYYTVDKLHTAINKKQQVAFNYWDWTLEKKEKVKHEEYKSVVTPYALCWDNENYYLVTYSSKHGKFINYRVDKMKSVELLEDQGDFAGIEAIENITAENHYFGLFVGKTERITIYFKNFLIGAVIDRFGKDLVISKSNKNGFTITVKMVVSPSFIAWMLGFGDNAKVVSPKSVIKQITAKAEEVIKSYK